MTIVICVVSVLVSATVAAWYAYWIGREHGYVEGMDRGARTGLTAKKRDELIREVLRTGDAHYTDGEGIVRRIETKKICEHSRHTKRVLRGGEGPDDSAKELSCPDCGATGWEWCDGSVSWRAGEK